MYYLHKNFINGRQCVSYVWRDGAYHKSEPWIWVDPVPFMVADVNGEYHLYTIDGQPIYVHAYRAIDTSVLESLLDNNSNNLIDNNNKELKGYVREGKV